MHQQGLLILDTRGSMYKLGVILDGIIFQGDYGNKTMTTIGTTNSTRPLLTIHLTFTFRFISHFNRWRRMVHSHGFFIYHVFHLAMSTCCVGEQTIKLARKHHTDRVQHQRVYDK